MPHRLFSKLASRQTFIVAAVVVACLIAVPARADVSDELFKLTPSDVNAVDLFGWNVAISGNIAIVGAHGDDDAGNLSGTAYLFDVTTGQQLRKLTASDAAANAVFGSSVAISGNVAIVGSPSHDNGVGSAYLFDVATGHELFKLSASDAAFRFLGSSVAISGNVAVVGAPSDDHAGVGSGSIYLFDVTTGQQLAKLTASDASVNSLFGASVAISGNTALVGAPFDDDIGDRAGSAYLFDVTAQQQLAKLTPSDGAPAFGGSVAISGNIALVGGGSRLDCCGSDAGSAYLFHVATRQEVAKITPSDGQAGDEFGDSVAISGNTAIVGAFRQDGLAGSAYLFDVTAGRELTKLTASDAEANDSFGFAVAISGNTAIVGSIGGEFGAADRFGAAYVFSAVPEPTGLALLALGLPLLICRNSRGSLSKKSRRHLMPKHLTLPFIATLCAIALEGVVGAGLASAAAGDIYNLGTLGGTSSAAYDVNDAGQVVGSAQDAVGRSRAFLWESSQGMTDLGPASGYTEARAHAISAFGSVVGVEYDNVTGVSHAFAWTPNEPNSTTGTLTDLARGDYSSAVDINAAGQVVGSNTYYVPDETCTPDNPYYPNCGGAGYYEARAVLWENGVSADLTSLLLDNPGFTLEAANAINNAGQVTGQSYHTAAHAFRYDDTSGSGGVMHDLGTLGGTTSIGNAINDAGQVVGDSWTTDDAGQHAFRYTGTPGAGGVMADLGALGGETSTAIDVNGAGFIVGNAERAGVAGGGAWATLWQNDIGNTAVDLDAWLDATNPTLGAYWALTAARGINNDGLITGQGMYDDGPGGLSDGYRAFVLDASSLTAAPQFVAGDFNGDSVVDAADLAQWKGDYGLDHESDADLDGDSDGADFLTWQRQLGQSAPGVALTATVPEPATALLLANGLVGVGAASRSMKRGYREN